MLQRKKRAEVGWQKLKDACVMYMYVDCMYNEGTESLDTGSGSLFIKIKEPGHHISAHLDKVVHQQYYYMRKKQGQKLSALVFARVPVSIPCVKPCLSAAQPSGSLGSSPMYSHNSIQHYVVALKPQRL